MQVMTSLEDRIAELGITSEATITDRNPNMDDMPAGSTHWTVTLSYDGRTMEVPFSQGPAISQEPSTADVLDCLASDAAGFENAQGFEDWASEYGYDTDSRSAERTYRAVESQTNELRTLLGDAYDAVLWETERA